MKKNTALLAVLNFLHLLLPVIGLLGCRVTFRYPWVMLLPLAIAAIPSILLLKNREQGLSGTGVVLAVLLILSAGANWGASLVWMEDWYFVIAGVSFLMVGATAMVLLHGAGKVIAGILLGLILLVLGALSLLNLLAVGFSANRVEQTVPSPNGSVIAEVVANDQGALGGATLVQVRKKPLHFGLFFLEVRPKTVYRGGWGEFPDMQLHWQDETTLVVNGTAVDTAD